MMRFKNKGLINSQHYDFNKQSLVPCTIANCLG